MSNIQAHIQISCSIVSNHKFVRRETVSDGVGCHWSLRIEWYWSSCCFPWWTISKQKIFFTFQWILIRPWRFHSRWQILLIVIVQFILFVFLFFAFFCDVPHLLKTTRNCVLATHLPTEIVIMWSLWCNNSCCTQIMSQQWLMHLLFMIRMRQQRLECS